MQRIFLILITLVAATSCSKKIKEKIGVVTPGPDEYKVQRGKALEIPPHYDLPTPGSDYNSQSSATEISANLNEGEKELIGNASSL